MERERADTTSFRTYFSVQRPRIRATHWWPQEPDRYSLAAEHAGKIPIWGSIAIKTDHVKVAATA